MQIYKKSSAELMCRLLRVHQRKEETAVQFRAHGADAEAVALSRIGYLHRTVRDRFVYSGNFDKITKQTEHGDFDRTFRNSYIRSSHSKDIAD